MTNFALLLDQYNALREKVHAYFGYTEDWRAIPLDDSRDYFWRLDCDDDGTGGNVRFAKSEDELANEEGSCFENEIWTCRHLSKHVYRGAEYTMVVVDTQMDGNKFLQVFSNARERPLADD